MTGRPSEQARQDERPLVVAATSGDEAAFVQRYRPEFDPTNVGSSSAARMMSRRASSPSAAAAHRRSTIEA
jgi:hypothetical protein